MTIEIKTLLDVKRARPRNCEACPFKSKTCASRGPIDSPFVIVGESPGKNEIVYNAAFVGDSGKFLESLFPEGAAEPYITNAFPCLPIGKDQRVLVEATHACERRLFEEINAYPRKVILALGNAAIWSTTGNYSLRSTIDRGTIFPSNLCSHGIIASVHPAYLLRGAGSQRLFKRDVGVAFDLLAQGKTKHEYVDPDFWVLESEQDVKDLIKLVSEHRYVAADIETSDFKYVPQKYEDRKKSKDPNVVNALIPREGVNRNRILSQGFCVDPKEAWIVPPHLFKYLGPIYGLETKFIWHFGKFDIGWLRYEAERAEDDGEYQLYNHRISTGGSRSGYELARVDEDTGLLSYTIEETRGIHDLERLSTDYLNAPNWKGMLDSYLPKKGASYAHVPPNVLYKYQAKDLSSTLQIFPIQREIVRKDPKLELEYTKTLIPATDFLQWVERNGFKVNEDQIKKNRNSFLNKKAGAFIRVNEVAKQVLGKEINPGSWQQVQKLLYTEGLDLAKGRVLTTDEDTLLLLPKHPAVRSILDYRSESKAIGTYCNGIEEEVGIDGRIHPSFLLHGTLTGRLASRDPNLQNIDRDSEIRLEFEAAFGYTLVELDLNQAELRCLTALSKDPALTLIYQDPKRSIHKEVAKSIFGTDYNHEQYMQIKALNFGIVYGRSAGSIAEEYSINESDAQAMIDGWSTKFKVAWAYIQSCRNAPAKRQILQTPFGRKRRFGRISGEHLYNAQNQAANFPHQSVASDITLHGGIEAKPQLIRWGIKCVDIVHDCWILEVPDNKELIEEVINYGKKVLESIPPKWGITHIPFLADAKEGKKWGTLAEYKSPYT